MNKKELFEQGYTVFRNFFLQDEIDKVYNDAKHVFLRQLHYKKMISSFDASDKRFTNALFHFFSDDLEGFMNCGKQVQHLISLHRLSLSEKVVKALKSLGLSSPVISTRPVLYFNHPNLAKEEIYYRVFPHQDWRSMRGSLDSIVVWLPLISLDDMMGPLHVLPKSHKWGLKSDVVEHGFGRVFLSKENEDAMKPVNIQVGDALFFSSFLVHMSGNNLSDRIRWSCHFRYNNLDEASFVKRTYPHPYLYKPMEQLLSQNFPTEKDIEGIFREKDE